LSEDWVGTVNELVDAAKSLWLGHIT
jgi:hypothetical protein